MIFVSGFSMYFFIFMGLIVISILFSIIYFFPSKFGYILYRIQTFLDPKSGDNFQAQKALDAIKQGGLTGQGMGEGILKDKVPEAHTDYIIAVISEEFGAFFVLFIIIIFLFLTHRITNKILIEKNEFLKLSLIGLISLLITQVFIHIGVNVRLLPTTGMTLPFLSYGGSSLLGIAITSGIILNFTRKDFLRDLHNE
jgi:cell division protein FtsW